MLWRFVILCRFFIDLFCRWRVILMRRKVRIAGFSMIRGSFVIGVRRFHSSVILIMKFLRRW